MAKKVFNVCKPDEYRKAGPSDLIELLPVPGSHPLFLMKADLEKLVYGITHYEFVHLSGPTGTAKSSVMEALYLVPKNFQALCKALGFPKLPLKLYPIQMAIFETPGELYQRRALRNGTTLDEKSKLVEALENAGKSNNKYYPVVWLREMGRVHSSSVQGGLLDMMTKGDIILSDGSRISGQRISWVADSNYQAEQDSTHTLVTFDDALKRRFSINMTLDYLSAEQEVQVLQQILKKHSDRKIQILDDNLIEKVVQLGNAVRRHRSEGDLQSVPPPTIWGYTAFLRMAGTLPHLNLQEIATSTLLGNASMEDRKQITGVFNEVFGLQNEDFDDPTLGVNLF